MEKNMSKNAEKPPAKTTIDKMLLF